MELKLDLHVHSYHSPDGRMDLDEIVTRCRRVGLDGCAVCDHDACLPPEEIRRIREAYPEFLLIPGTEVSTELGHLLGWFVTEPVDSRDLRAAAEAIHAQGGIAVLAHPFEHTADPSRPVPAAGYIDGTEVWNSRADRKNRKANAMAEEFARAHGLRRFAGSDAHVLREIGNAVTVLNVEPDGGADGIAEKTAGGNAERTAGGNAEGTADGNAEETADKRGTIAGRTDGIPDLSTVKAALLRGDTRPSGVRSRAIDTARSQFTRRRNLHAGPISYCKWALFAVKCLGTDLLSGLGIRN